MVNTFSEIGYHNCMDKKRTYYGYTTFQQRQLLFETWEATGNVTYACKKAKVSRGTFYTWKPRFVAGGYEGLREFESRAPHHPRKKDAALTTRVIELRRAHPDWGKTRISHEIAKEHSWAPTVGPNTVKRILKDAGLWPERGAETKAELTVAARSAELPGQTVNVDICYIPVMHAPAIKPPAVSGSSGHLVVEHVPEVAAAPPTWPGQVFACEALEYVSAMEHYVAETRDRLVQRHGCREVQVDEPRPWRLQQALRAERYEVRERRKQEDLLWRAAKDQWRTTRENRKTLTKGEFAEAQAAWTQVRRERQARVRQRQVENQAWHASLAQLRAQAEAENPPREWIAVLVITDNCTRQCLGLPVFTSGAHLGSQEMITGLKEYLPPDVAFLISDQGTHFRAQVFAQFAREAEFVHVPIYRHRPTSNGIAERLVRTLKDCLRPATWDSYEAVLSLLATFQVEYNNRPHQGLPTPGLSPNEFANRAWVM